jgi:hypothetical protein
VPDRLDPKLYPIIKPDRYGLDSDNGECLYLENQGAPADDVTAFLMDCIDGWSVKFGDPRRVTSRELGVFPVSIIKGDHGCGNRPEEIWPDAWKPIDKKVELYITYRDFRGAPYRLDCTLERTSKGFKVSCSKPAQPLTDSVPRGGYD